MERASRMPPFLLLLLGQFVGSAVAQPAEPRMIVTVSAPENLQGEFEGLLGNFSASLAQHSGNITYRIWAPSEPLGCSAVESPIVPEAPFVAVVLRGNCTFRLKAEVAQQSGAAGVIVVNNVSSIQVMSDSEPDPVAILAMMVSKDLGDKLLSASDDVRLSFVALEVSIDLSEIIMIFLATFLVALGAFFATADLRPGSPIAPQTGEVVKPDETFAYGFCFMGSIMLVVLYFFMRYLIYFIIFMFCVGGASCIIQGGSSILHYQFATLKKRAFNIPMLGPVTKGEIIASVPALGIVGLWLWLRNTPSGWLWQDIIGACFLCWMQRSLQLPDLKIATILLTAMFFFDIFWVFLSPLFFPSSVMVEVATGGGTGQAVPMLLRIPDFDGGPWSRERLLGFGDIAIPGLLISYLRRHDILSRRRCFEGYFFFAVIGYFCGLSCTIVALVIMKMGQPALLYLVPFTLWTTLALAKCRGELHLLWNGKPAGYSGNGQNSAGDSNAAEAALEHRP